MIRKLVGQAVQGRGTAGVISHEKRMPGEAGYIGLALRLLGIRGAGRSRLLRLGLVVLAAWSLLAWGSASALITKADLAKADVIVVLANPSAFVERTRHAADLWKSGRAPRILLTNENLLSSWSEKEQRNPLFSDRATKELTGSGVPADKIEVLPKMVANTFEEAVAAREYAQANKLRSILIVTSAYHSRRALWTFQTVFRDTGIAIGLDPVAPGFQTPSPATWWLKPAAWKVVALEYPKYLYYLIMHRSPAGESMEVAGFSGPEVKVVTGSTQAAVTLTLAAPVSAYTNEVVLIDARRSVGVPNKPQLDGTPSFTMNFGDGFTCNLLACGHAFRNAGTYTISISAKGRSGVALAPVTTTIQVSDIPDAINVIDMSAAGNSAFYIPSAAYRNATANAAKLQAAIKRAAANNGTAEQEIVLPAGAVFAGPIVLPPPAGSKYITIRSGSLGSMVGGRRVGPGQGSLMPVIT
ncbi:MAG TPA: ElyC/SanA/YdcF family protein, partial [Pyrinomonadaceae bacterium]|nr:ElyC/SanA/YdcF family protein [Pyrinomonadaceae bacterium]